MGKRKTAVGLLAFSLMFSSFGMSAGATGVDRNNSKDAGKLAELVGEYNLKSSKQKTVIVEITEPGMAEAKKNGKGQTKQKLKSSRNQVISEVKNAVGNAKVKQEYDHVFSGFSLEITEKDIPSLLSIPGVKAVYPDVEYTTTSVDEGTVISSEEYSPAMLKSAPFIGSDDAWEAGYTGEGVTVAVIDTGVDYTHPDLDQAFGSYKGWDFVDNDNDPQETPTGDPRGASTTHGTHVAGTVAADGLIKGVAPEATLLAYRVLGPGGSGTTANVIAGIEKAVEDGADIMNLSLGSSINDPDSATSIALDWAMEEGVVAVTSNGNSGPDTWTVGSPGSSRDAISVGATALPYNVYTSSIATSEGESYPSAKVMGFPSDEALLTLNGGEYEFVDVGLGAPADFEGKDLTGKIALMSRGTLAFVDKATNAKNAGAVGAIIFNNVAGEQPDVAGMDVPTIKTTLEDGQKLLDELAAGNNKVTFAIDFSHEVGETVADFSSRGPVNINYMVKPDVSAPGVNIVSTVPTFDPANPHGYGAKQGTSMASPHVAGAAALILQANPKWDVEDVKAALMNTAESIIDPLTGNAYPHNTQGAGSIRVLDAVETTTLITPGSYSFGVFDKANDKIKNRGKGKGKQSGTQTKKTKFTIENLSSKRQTYSINVNLENESKAIKVNTSKSVRVNPGKKQEINVEAKVDVDKLEPGYYEGTVNISDGRESYDVPIILFVKEPDYPRVEWLGAAQLGADEFVIEGFFPGGAESVDLFVYLSNADGQPVEYLGDIGVYENIPAGYTTFDWDGVLSNGVKIPGGYYYNIYANATYKGQTDLAGTNVFVE